MERKLLYLFHRGFYCKNSTSLFSTHHSQQQVWCAYHLLISISHKYFNKRDKNEIAILNPLVSRWHYVIALMNLIIGMFLHGFWYEGSFIFVMWKPEIQLTKRRTMKYFNVYNMNVSATQLGIPCARQRRLSFNIIPNIVLEKA